MSLELLKVLVSLLVEASPSHFSLGSRLVYEDVFLGGRLKLLGRCWYLQAMSRRRVWLNAVEEYHP